MAKTKKFYESKTFWLNVLVMLALIAELVADTGWLSITVTAFVANVLNVVMRVWFTTQPVSIN